MTYPIYDLKNNLNWDMVLQRSYQVQAQLDPNLEPGAGSYVPIPEITVGVDRPVLIIGVKSATANPKWWLGAWVSQLLILEPAPSYTSNFDPKIVDTARYKVRLNFLNLIRFPRLEPRPYIVSIKIPKWIKQADIEVWKYSGLESDSTEEMVSTLNQYQSERLHRIESKLDNLIAGAS